MKKSYIVFAVMLGGGMFFSACGNKKTGGADTKTENTETIEEDLKMDDFVIEVVSVQANDPSLTARVVLKIQENEKCPSDLQRIENIWLDIGGVRQVEEQSSYCIVTQTGTYQDQNMLKELGFTNTNDGKWDRYTCETGENKISMVDGQIFDLERNGASMSLIITPFSVTLFTPDPAWRTEQERIVFSAVLENDEERRLITIPPGKKGTEESEESAHNLEERV